MGLLRAPNTADLSTALRGPADRAARRRPRGPRGRCTSMTAPARGASRLIAGMLEIARRGQLLTAVDSPYGIKYVVEGILTGPTGRAPSVVTDAIRPMARSEILHARPLSLSAESGGHGPQH